MSFLFKDIISADTLELPHITACFRAMTEALKLGVHLFMRPADFIVRPTVSSGYARTTLPPSSGVLT
jgi:hypothetical protein